MNRRGVIAAMGFFSLLFGKPGSAQQPKPGKNPADAGRDLRNMMLSSTAAKWSVTPSSEFPRVYGVLLDWPLDRDTASIFATSTGSASLYTTSTFGIIGGERHATVRAAAIKFTRAADRLYDSTTPTTAFPHPGSDKVRFYLLTYDGVQVLEADLAAIVDRSSKYTEFFDLGQAVLTELRLVTEGR